MFIYLYAYVYLPRYLLCLMFVSFRQRHWRWEAPSTPPWRFPLLDGGPTLCWLYLGDDVDWWFFRMGNPAAM